MLQGSHKGASPPSTGGALWGDCYFMHEYRRDHQLVVLRDSSLNPLGKLVGSIAVRAPLFWYCKARCSQWRNSLREDSIHSPIRMCIGIRVCLECLRAMSLQSSELEGSTIVRIWLGPQLSLHYTLVQSIVIVRARICTCHRRLKCAAKGSRSSMGKDIRRPQPRPQAIIM